MQAKKEPVITIRDFTEDDIVAQDEYFKTATDEFLTNMGVNVAVARNLPPSSRAQKILALPIKDRPINNFTVEVDGQRIGLFVVKEIHIGDRADLHVHIFDLANRRQGYASKIFWSVVAKVFEVYDVKVIICEPAATNPGPNALLQKMGLQVVSQVVTPASGLLVEHIANRYEITKEFFEKIRS